MSRCTIYSPTSYSVDTPPPRQSGYTRFVCLSDTHGRVFKVPDGDVLLHCGDLTEIGQQHEFDKTIDWLAELPHETKIVIAGNHDFPLDQNYYHDRGYKRFHEKEGLPKVDTEALSQLFTSSEKAKNGRIHYLRDEALSVTLKNGKTWRFFGSPWTPEFCDYAFGYPQCSTLSKTIMQKMTECDVLLTHGPPWDILDRCWTGEKAGCEELAERVKELKPLLHVFGHIHEGLGYVQKEETSYVNAACMDMILKSPRAPTRDVVPFIVDIKND